MAPERCMNREKTVNTLYRSLAFALVALLASGLAQAVKFGDFELNGFAKDEFSMCDNCALGLSNPSSYDPRGVLNPPTPMLNQPGRSGQTTANLGLAMLTAGLNHEFDNAWSVTGRATARIRNNGPDIYGNYAIDLYAGIAYPKWGSLDVGKITSRAWTRSDSFAYPMGLSSAWAESGAGYGVFPEALRYATREFEIGVGKIRFELTGATATRRGPLNPTSAVVAGPKPRLLEAFIQYSNAKNLVEIIFQGSRGGRQSSFSKGAFYGAQGDTNGPSTSPDYQAPTENVLFIEGTHWFNPTWKLNYGVKRNEWSGQQQQCDYGPTSPIASNCFWDQPGFNYGSDFQRHHAIEWDAMLGVGYTYRLWTFTVGGVRYNKAYTRTPTEWGQSNSATFVNFGVYRKLPELSKHMELYGGIGKVVFDKQLPAPISFPNNTAFFNTDPRESRSANSLTLGANFIF